jgi:predicted glycoside hydrolase/deacetylase ChbG (UPF0249 family)
MRRLLVVNADDFGRSDGVNEGVAIAHERGIVTSASLMVRWPSAAGAAEYARSHPALGVGLHVDLGEWELCDGEWRAVYEVADGSDVEREVHAQLDLFRVLVGRDPTHLDSHQHVHREEPARSVMRALGNELGVPVRGESPVAYCGSFYGAGADGSSLPEQVSPEWLVDLVVALEPGATEIGCHPASRADVASVYAAQRVSELRTLCSPTVRNAIEAHGVELCSFPVAAAAMRERSFESPGLALRAWHD